MGSDSLLILTGIVSIFLSAWSQPVLPKANAISAILFHKENITCAVLAKLLYATMAAG